jgi:hypothetical protein
MLGIGEGALSPASGDLGMRDWLLVLLPLALVLYFVVFPDHFDLVLGWLDSLLFQH